ncbi:hypothetical protein [Xanthobacter versatilis]|uniref:hypothetical protein n=1 Tax=Xanthobacter autotrophicus (strain ATCC BAA-1158 / Py2) TaxID=78245 RepID=UPI00372B6D5A
MSLGYFDPTAGMTGENQGDARRRLAMALMSSQQAPRNLGEGLNQLGRTMMGAMIYRGQRDATAKADDTGYGTVAGAAPQAAQPSPAAPAGQASPGLFGLGAFLPPQGRPFNFNPFAPQSGASSIY